MEYIYVIVAIYNEMLLCLFFIEKEVCSVVQL